MEEAGADDYFIHGFPPGCNQIPDKKSLFKG